jgi:hypothetical protein
MEISMPVDAAYRTTGPAPETVRDAVEPASVSRSSIAAIVIGGLIAAALMLLFDFLGIGLGLGLTQIGDNGDAVTDFAVGGVIFLILTSIIATGAGGFAGGRLSGALTTATAAMHGAGVWALSTMIILFGLSYYGSLAASGAWATVVNAGQSLRAAGEAVIPEDASLPNVSLPDISMQDLPPEVRDALEEQNLTVEELRREARTIAYELVDRQERQRIADAASGTAASIIRSPGDAAAELESLIDRLIGAGGVLSEEDLAEAREMLSERLGVTPDEAEQLVERWSQRIEEAAAQAQQAYQEARAAAADALDTAVDTLTWASLVAFIVSAAGLAAGVAGAAAGRPKPLS